MSEHSFDLVINTFNCLLICILNYHLMYHANLFNKLFLYLCLQRLRGLLLPLDLLLLGLSLTGYLLCELLLRCLLVLIFRVRHRIVHIIYHTLVIVLLYYLVSDRLWLRLRFFTGFFLLGFLHLSKFLLNVDIFVIDIII